MDTSCLFPLANMLVLQSLGLTFSLDLRYHYLYKIAQTTQTMIQQLLKKITKFTEKSQLMAGMKAIDGLSKAIDYQAMTIPSIDALDARTRRLVEDYIASWQAFQATDRDYLEAQNLMTDPDEVAKDDAFQKERREDTKKRARARGVTPSYIFQLDPRQLRLMDAQKAYEKSLADMIDLSKELHATLGISEIPAIQEVTDKVATINEGITAYFERPEVKKKEFPRVGKVYDNESGCYVTDGRLHNEWTEKVQAENARMQILSRELFYPSIQMDKDLNRIVLSLYLQGLMAHLTTITT